MPNTKSAARRMRNSAAKRDRNHSVKSRLHTLERNYADSLSTGKKEEALTAFRTLTSALDKAAKTGVVNRTMANRKKSRLAVRLNAPAKAPATEKAKA
jgi:small subunit ribosomal protein S20